MKKTKLLKNGIVDENPVLRLVLGTCPTLAVSTTVIGGLGMGLATTFVLIFSNMIISSLRKIIPETVRIPSFITIIAGIVTVMEMLVKAFVPVLDSMLGIYLPLIAVNCIIFGRAEMFASKNTVIDSMFDGIGMGLGFTAALVALGSAREILGAGTWAGMQIFPSEFALKIMTSSPGGFFMFGCAIALLSAIMSKSGKKLNVKNHCINCQGCAGCEEVGIS